MIPQFSNCWNHSNWHSFTCPSFTAVLPSAIFSLSREPGKRKLGWNWGVSLAPLWRVQATWHCSLIPWTRNALQVSHLRSKMPCWESFFQVGYRKCKTNCLCGLAGWKKTEVVVKRYFIVRVSPLFGWTSLVGENESTGSLSDLIPSWEYEKLACESCSWGFFASENSSRPSNKA